MSAQLDQIAKERYCWTNATNNVQTTPLKFFYPRNRQDISDIVKDAEEKGLRVRAVGSGHSFSEVAKGDDYLLSMKRLSKVKRTEKNALYSDFHQSHFVTAEAGIVLKELNWKLDAMKPALALPNMGAVDFQTLSGALLTGTHGTGINKPTFPDLVRAIRLIGAGGKAIQIEPSQGISDPQKHKEVHGIELIQDDDTFYSAVLSMGAMGIVYELVLEVVPAFWMKEKRYLKPWKRLRKELLDGCFMQLVEDTDFVAFRANPYEVDGDHLCAVVEQTIIPEAEQPKGWNARYRNLLSTIGGNWEYLIESTIQALIRKPEKAKNRIQSALRLTKDAGFTGKSYKVLYQSGLAVIRHGISSEFAFDAKGEKVVEVLENVFDLAKRNAEEGGLFQSSHIPVRFTQAAEAYLSSAYHRKTAYIDIPLLHGTTGDYEILNRYQDMMMDLGGIPHWGKINSQLYHRTDFIKKHYKKLNTWIAVREKLDPKGTFINDFLLEMELAQENVVLPSSGKKPTKTSHV